MAPLKQTLTALFTLQTLLSFTTVFAFESDGPSPWGNGTSPDTVLDLNATDNVPDQEGPIDYGNDEYTYNFNASNDDSGNDTSTVHERRAAQDFYLRIMPLGASITQGVRSADGNGYRKFFRDSVRATGWKVNMIGSKSDGEMLDNDNEGHPGFMTQKANGDPSVWTVWQGNAWRKPNLILLNVGTNDCGFNNDPDHAGVRLKAIIDDILDKVPGVCVVMSTIAPSRDHNPCAMDVSNQYRELYKASYANNPRIGFADLFNAITLDELSDDGTHPYSPGYKKFANAFLEGFKSVEPYISAPTDVSGEDDTVHSADGGGGVSGDETGNGDQSCRKRAGDAKGHAQIQKGSGVDDGKYQHKSKHRGFLEDAKIARSPTQSVDDGTPTHMFFAQLINAQNLDRSKSLDDWIRIVHENGKNTYYIRENLGGGAFGTSKVFDPDFNCDAGPAYAWADINNDGLADFICIGAKSSASVSINLGGNPPKFKSLGRIVPEHEGFDSQDVRFADIDGDGRADFCLVKDDGDVLCSRNGGTEDMPRWEGFKGFKSRRDTVFVGKNEGDKRGVTFGDLNGDFRSDWMWISDEGAIDTWINQRGWGKGGIIPDWVSSGRTHPGMGIKGARTHIKLGRIFGSGRLDYMHLEKREDYWHIEVWENLGHGGTKRKADGNYYCDMRGTKRDDYVWIYSDGHAGKIYANIEAPPEWGQSIKIEINVPGPRNGIHLGDWTGDGKCDILVQDKANGALHLYENSYDPKARTITFIDRGIIPGTAGQCHQGWGVGLFDRGMAIADVDGDGRADMLCIEPNGRITGLLNGKAGIEDVGQIKFSQGWDRANMRFADVESSGRVDIIHLNKYTGAGEVFKNLGHHPGGKGSSFSWSNRGTLFAGIDRGENMKFADLRGDGRADLIHILPVTNRAWAYWNQCSGKAGGGDDSTTVDPGLGDGTNDPADDGDTDEWNAQNQDESTDEILEDIPLRDCSVKKVNGLDNIDDMNRAVAAGQGDEYPLGCRPYYVVTGVLTDFVDAINQYVDMRPTYGKKWETYANAVVDSAEQSIADYVQKSGNDWFTCRVAEEVLCCDKCGDPDSSDCFYCFTDKPCETTITSKRNIGMRGNSLYRNSTYSLDPRQIGQGPTRQEDALENVDVDEPCPPDFSKRATTKGDDSNSQSVWWALKDGKADDLWSKISANTGIPEDKMDRGLHIRIDTCDPSAGDHDQCTRLGRDFDFPIPDGYGIYDVPDPSVSVFKSFDNAQKVLDQMRETKTNMELGTYYGDESEIADALVVPAILIINSVKQMQKIEEIAEKIDAEKRKAFILAFIGALLLVIPVLGEVAGSVTGSAAIAGSLVAVGVAGDIALSTYSIVDDPDNPLLGIMGLILAPLGLTDVVAASRAARLRRGMSDDSLAKLMGNVPKDMKTTHTALGSCKPRL